MNSTLVPSTVEVLKLAMINHHANLNHTLRLNKNIIVSAGSSGDPAAHSTETGMNARFGTDIGSVGSKGASPSSSEVGMSSQAVVLGLLLVLVFLASVVANAFVLVVFCKRKSLSLSNRFVANLTVCNCLNAFFVMPFALASLVAQRWLFGETWCICTGFLMSVLVTASILTLAVISIDRYFAVVTPLHYSMRLTSRRCSLLILSIWAGAIVISAPPILGWNSIVFQVDKMVCTVNWSSARAADAYYTFFLVSCSFLLPLVAMLWTYARIFRAARGNSVRARRNSVIRGSSSNGNSGHRGSVKGNPANNTPESSCSSCKIAVTKQNSGSNSSSDAETSIKSLPANSSATSLSQQMATPLNGRRRSSTVPIIRRLSQSSSRSSSLLWRMEEWKTAVTSFLVLSSFAVCWAPYFVVMSVEAALGASTSSSDKLTTTSIPTALPSSSTTSLPSPSSSSSSSLTSSSPSSAYPDSWPLISSVSIVLAMASCAVNPLVYVFRNKVFRKDLRLIVKRRRFWLLGGGAKEAVCVPQEISGGLGSASGGKNPASRRASVVRNESGRSLKSMAELEESEEGGADEMEALRAAHKSDLTGRLELPGNGRTRKNAVFSRQVRYGDGEVTSEEEKRLAV
ncbi:tyramine receptor tyra-2-like [Elysia marginata]|uniref:Tyramine receptor tyra-2-like n=1 Tax=Elysia marginata TaxID=1093978 RepID=A0AAV4JXD2_9GAST|nr:tyramine receptor tyra-2-like [Elysia marginata]